VTLYRLLDGISGRPGVGSTGTQPPAAPTAYAGPWLDGTLWSVTQGGMWLNAYWKYVPAGGDTVARKFCTWAHNAATTGVLIPGSTVTSGVLTAGAFNRIPLPTPIPVPIGFLLNSCTGWTAVNGFTNTTHQFGAANPYAAGIVSGPLTGWSSSGGTNPAPQYNTAAQSPFSTAGNDPTVNMPAVNDLDDIFWTDIEVSDTAPAGYPDAGFGFTFAVGGL